MATPEQAIALAAMAHAGQVDKAGQPYILHPLRVMLGVASEHERMLALALVVWLVRQFWRRVIRK